MIPDRPGFYLFQQRGQPAERVEVVEDDGELVTWFPNHQPEDPPVPVRYMDGGWQPV